MNIFLRADFLKSTFWKFWSRKFWPPLKKFGKILKKCAIESFWLAEYDYIHRIKFTLMFVAQKNEENSHLTLSHTSVVFNGPWTTSKTFPKYYWPSKSATTWTDKHSRATPAKYGTSHKCSSRANRWLGFKGVAECGNCTNTHNFFFSLRPDPPPHPTPLIGYNFPTIHVFSQFLH